MLAKLFSQDLKTLSAHVRFALCGVLLGMLCGLIILGCGRLAFISTFGREAFAALDEGVLPNFLKTAFLFDLKYSAQAYLPAVVLALILGINRRGCSLYRKIFIPLILLGFLYLTVLTIINHYYYLTYTKIIDVFFFAFFKEDPWAVMSTLWHDYPLLLGSLLLVLGTAAFIYVFAKAQRWAAAHLTVPRGRWSTVAAVVVFALAYALCIRGSLGTFPLRQDNSQVSRNPVVNAAVANGPAALHWARKWARHQSVIPEVKPEEIVAAYQELGLAADSTDLYAPLQVTTATNAYLTEHKPDIVVSVMESLGVHMLGYDALPERDLYGALREPAAEDYFFLNFLSEGNGTMDSLTRLLLSVPDLNLSTSVQADRDYVTNVLKPFKAQGYKVLFITGCAGAWRNMDTFMHTLGVDEIYEESYLRTLYPEATHFAWGTDDEYMWKVVLKTLREPHEQPLLILTLSISNHPPFRVPGAHEPKSIKLTDAELKRFPYPDTPTIFAAFRYANDQLGEFIQEVKHDPKLGSRTILSATGDHNMRGIGYDAHPEELALGHAVPFYLYVPESYRQHEELFYDPKRYGSQKDIFSTIAHRALSAATLHTLGCDLLSKEPCRYPLAFNAEAAVPQSGRIVCNLDSRFAFEALDLDDDGLRSDSLIERSDPLCAKAKALSKLEQLLYFYQSKHAPRLRQ
ncbi:MAG: sulfatase-like hydrolase/transferase [Succinivibrio sp.]|nr:sulfatase-like hydrolase/transferase [Succinivibrio sp.]